MRTAFINELIELARKDSRVCLLTGDLGFNVLEPFEREFPDRFLNAGVAEQNMTGMAAGMAMEGKIVFTYSIANFPSLRCLEQIRNDVCYHKANVKIVSVGAGLAYGTHGYTHQGVEDLGIVRCLPFISVVSPADAQEARITAKLAVENTGPMYIRLGKNREPIIHGSNFDFAYGQAIPIYEGKDVTFVATGSIAYEALQATEKLRAKGYDVGFISLPFVKPIDTKTLIESAQNTKWIVSVEEHSQTGGLGSALAEIYARENFRAKLHCVSLPEIVKEIGSQSWLRGLYGLSADGLVSTVQTLLR